MPGTDRRNSSSSEDASVPPTRPDGTEFIPTRTPKTSASKPAANPLQFIKVGPCDLYKSAQEQLKKVEEIKKVEKTVKTESEDWQSNLDNWKCSRRKRQEHIIERVVESKKLELEEHERNRRRGKTLSEMMEERTQKGVGPRKSSLLVYPAEDASDLTDLGISVAPEKQNGNSSENSSETDNHSEENGNDEKKNGTNGHGLSSPEPEEYTYERAIQGYKTFAEKTVKPVNRPRVSPPKPGGRIGEKLNELEQVRLRSNSVSDVQLPKVDIHKRRSLFEVVEIAETPSPSAERVARDLGGAKIVKERLSLLGQRPESVEKTPPRVADEVCITLKDRLSNLEKQKSAEPAARISNGDIAHISIKERLTSLEKGFKESIVSSDEEINQKDLLSPAVSDREVSSPLVSSNLGTNNGTEVTKNDEMVMGLDSHVPNVSKSSANQEEIILKTIRDIKADDNLKTAISKNRPITINKPTPIKSRKITKKPTVRTRKLTPMITTTPIAVTSPIKSPTDLKIISEDLTEIGNEPNTGKNTAKGAETSESGIDMEESSLYTDENIDEVLGEDDEDDYVVGGDDDQHVPDSAHDLELSRKQILECKNDSGFTDFEKIHKQDELKPKQMVVDVPDPVERRQQEAVTRFDELIGFNTDEKCTDHVVVVEDDGAGKLEEIGKIIEQPLIDLIGKDEPAAVNYENLIIANQLSHTSEIVGFSLSPMNCVEPPKEKPPPPPVDLSDDELIAPEIPPKSSLRRLDSTKRIKKEIRKKRSDFLGIEGTNDDAYLEPEVNVEPPPDMITLLQEERRLQQQLYRQSISSDSVENNDAQSNPVDRLDKALFSDQGLYRQSICSETDSNHETAESRDSGVELDRGHIDDLCWNKQSSEPHSRQNSEPYGNPSVTSEEDEISKKEREIIEVLEKEEEWRYGKALSAPQDSAIGETLAVKLRQLEQEKLQLEWERAEEEGRRMADEERILAKETLLRQQETSPNLNQSAALNEDNLRAERERLEKEQIELARVRQELIARQRSTERPQQAPMGSNLRYSMPDLQETRAPAPNARPSQTWNRVPSADNLLQPQQMSKTTLQALAAAPRSRIVHGDGWMQPKRKADASKSSYNYQHWLIQEAEHRRITEQQQRANLSRRSLPTQPRYSPSQQQPQQRPHSGHFAPLVSPLPYSPNQTIMPVAHINGVHYGSPNRVATSPNSHVHSAVSPPSHNTIGLPPTPPAMTGKPLPETVIQTITQRVQNKTSSSPRRRVVKERPSPNKSINSAEPTHVNGEQERMLSVSGKKKCSHCGDELGRGAAMVIESLRLFYHIDCFKCCVCHTQLGDGLMGTDVRVRNNKLHCHNCYSSDDGVTAFPIEVIDKEDGCQNCCAAASAMEAFFQQYQENEDRKYVQQQLMHLDMVEIEIRKYELLKSAISGLSNLYEK